MKRLFDVVASLVLLVVMAPVFVLIALCIVILDGRPVFYVSERMKTHQDGFRFFKFRTMRQVDGDAGVSGRDKEDRITRTGRFLRRYRLDELPQLINVLIGDMSFVGPRPPLRQYVERFPALYETVLQSRPGITGLATVVYHGVEEDLLSESTSARETDRIYTSRCVPRKAELDRIYLRRRTFALDVAILLATFAGFRRARALFHR